MKSVYNKSSIIKDFVKMSISRNERVLLKDLGETNNNINVNIECNRK